MRRRLVLTVAACTVMVLLAMLVPMAVLVNQYAVEDRLARAALEVQATESVVAGRDKGAVAVHLESVNAGDRSTATTVLYPDGTAIGPSPGEDARVDAARRTGRARVDDRAGGAEILVPVAMGGSSALPQQTPVIRVVVAEGGVVSRVGLAWGVLAVLGVTLLVGSVVLADRLGRSFVQPILSLAAAAQRLGDDDLSTRVQLEGPREVQEVAAALNRLVERVTVLLERERENVAELSHRLRTPITRLRLAVESLPDAAERVRLTSDLDTLSRMIDDVVREARRSQREGLSANGDLAAVVQARTAFWRPLAEDQRRPFEVAAPVDGVAVAASTTDLEVMLDALLDNVFTHTPEGAAIAVRVQQSEDGVVLTVDDGGPAPAGDRDRVGAAIGRGISTSGSTGLGLSIARRTAEASGGQLRVQRSSLGGTRVLVRLGPA